MENVNNNPLVSIIMPCYNHAKYIETAISSVIDQTFKEWELIIIDDGSTDDTKSIVLPFINKGHNIKYFNQSNRGVSAARNTALSKSIGKYILPLDGDDKIHKKYLEEAVSFMEENPDYSVYYCRAEYFGDLKGEFPVSWKGYKSHLLNNAIFNCALFRKEDACILGGYDESLIYGLEDWDFFIRLLYKDKKVFQSDYVRFFYRKDFSHKSVSRVVGQSKGQAFYDLYKKHVDKYIEFYGNPYDILRDYNQLKEWSTHRLPMMLKKFMVWYQKTINRFHN